MLKNLKIFFYLNKSWIYSLQYILVSIVLVTFVTLIDIKILPLQPFIPSIFFTTVSLAQDVLITLAGALLTITTFTYATIISALILYSNSFTPRVMDNFLNIDVTMKVLGLFMGGFFYCITALAFMRDKLTHELVISGIIAILYSIICVFYFIVFVQKVLYNLQVVNVINNIYEEALPIIQKELNNRITTEEYLKEFGDNKVDIKLQDSGYLIAIDYNKLEKVLKNKKGLFKIESRIGDYLTQNLKVGTLNLENCQINDNEYEKILNCFILKEKKVYQEDYRFNITKLVEIALKSISPSINDPNTAIHSIRKIGLLLSKLASVDDFHISKLNNIECKVYYTSYSLEEELYLTFYQIVHYGKDDVSVMKTIFESLNIIYLSATNKNRKLIKDYVDRLYNSTINNFENPMDKKYLEEFYSNFFKN